MILGDGSSVRKYFILLIRLTTCTLCNIKLFYLCVGDGVRFFPVSDPVMLVYPILLFAVGYYSSRCYPVVRTGCEVSFIIKGFFHTMSRLPLSLFSP